MFRIALRLLHFKRSKQFPGTVQYWEQRYKSGGNSGPGSYNRLAAFKAEVINRFVAEKNIQSVIDFGCGDGNNLLLMQFPHYTGLDVSPTAIEICREKFKHDETKKFFLYNDSNSHLFNAYLSLSADVIYHLVEDDLYEKYMRYLFDAAEKYVIIYAVMKTNEFSYHEKGRDFLQWIQVNKPSFKLINTVENRYKYYSKDPHNTSNASFFFFEKIKPIIS